MKIMRRNIGRTDAQRHDFLRLEMDNPILVLNLAMHSHKPFMHHDHRIGAVHIRHNNDIGVARFIFKREKDQSFRSPWSLAGGRRIEAPTL